MAAETEERLLSAEELARMPIEGACELVRGRIVRMSPTGAPHALVVGIVLDILCHHVRLHQLGLVTSGEAGFWVERKPDTVRAPDLAFISHATIERAEESKDTYIPVAPDLAVEVLSPSDTWPKVNKKVGEYLEAGGKAVWVLCPKTKTVYVYEAGSPPQILDSNDELDGSSVLPGFRVPVASLFRLPKPTG